MNNEALAAVSEEWIGLVGAAVDKVVNGVTTALKNEVEFVDVDVEGIDDLVGVVGVDKLSDIVEAGT